MVKRVLGLLTLSACAPNLGAPASLVTGERIVAVSSSPAEAKPGAMVTFTALQVSLDGTGDGSDVSWSLCTSPKPLSENDTVARACLDDAGALVAVGTGDTVMGTLPANGCQLFGPDPPPQAQASAPLRPRDPDVTGGYYQPLRVDEGSGVSFELARMTCNLANASAAVVSDFATRYTPNQNPTIASVTDVGAVAAGSDVPLRVDWSAESAETFPVLDITTFALVDQREAMRVSWFTTAGSLALDRSGRDADQTETFAENTWHVPTTPGPAFLWMVLRDSRGGVAWKSVIATVQ